MASTSMSLGKHWEKFLKEKVASGEYGSATDVVRAALRDMQEQDQRLAALDAFIKKGDESGYVDWSKDDFEKRVKSRYLSVADNPQNDFEHEG